MTPQPDVLGSRRIWRTPHPSGFREGILCNDALHVIGLHGPGDKVSLSLLAGLGAGKGGIELSHGPGHAVPGNCMRPW